MELGQAVHNLRMGQKKSKFQMMFENPLRQIKIKTHIDRLIRLREHSAKELKEVIHAIWLTQKIKFNYTASRRNNTHYRMDKQYSR